MIRMFCCPILLQIRKRIWPFSTKMAKSFCALVIKLFIFLTLAFPVLQAQEAVPIQKRLEEYIRFDPTGNNEVGLITIADHSTAIDQSTWIYVKSALDFYKTRKPIFIILRLDTPGGEVFAAQKISDALKQMDTQYHIPIVALIDNWAISAGAMLAYSCRYIAVVKDGSMGAAEPIQLGEGGEMKAASEKVNSALRADFGNRARFFDRNPAIAEKMVDKDIILVQRGGEIIKLDLEQQMQLTGPTPDKIISPKGKLLTLTAEELMNDGVADIYLPPAALPVITDVEQQQGSWPADKMLLFQYPFFKAIPRAFVHEYRMDWRTSFLAFMARPAVASLLFLGMIIGFYLEMSNPGHGLSGSLAVICLMLLLLSSFALEALNVLEIVLMAMGAAIIVIDLFFFPTFGLLGSVGSFFFLAGLLGILLPGLGSVSFELDTQTLNAAGEAVLERAAWFSGSLVVAVVIMILLGRYLTPRFTLFRRFVSTGEQELSKGFVAGLELSRMPKPGEEGVSASTLRPAGKVVIHGTLYDAVSIGTFIDRGEKIVVVDIDGYRIVVDKKGVA